MVKGTFDYQKQPKHFFVFTSVKEFNQLSEIAISLKDFAANIHSSTKSN
jgi:hypothetical protein